MSQVLEALKGQSYISLSTYRKSGAAVATPVWFAESGGRLYITTTPDAGKAKRLRNNGGVDFAPCTYNGTVTGQSFHGQGRILPAGPEAEQAEKLLQAKYGLQYRLFNLFMKKSRRIFLEVQPA
jgi:PPOX class probable F420-dependent enzyme